MRHARREYQVGQTNKGGVAGGSVERVVIGVVASEIHPAQVRAQTPGRACNGM